jgi:hypothetical protein
VIKLSETSCVSVNLKAWNADWRDFLASLDVFRGGYIFLFATQLLLHAGGGCPIWYELLCSIILAAFLEDTFIQWKYFDAGSGETVVHIEESKTLNVIQNSAIIVHLTKLLP